MATDNGGAAKRQNRVSRFLKEQKGPTAIEYGLIAALVAVAIIAAVLFLGQALGSIFFP